MQKTVQVWQSLSAHVLHSSSHTVYFQLSSEAHPAGGGCNLGPSEDLKGESGVKLFLSPE